MLIVEDHEAFRIRLGASYPDDQLKRMVSRKLSEFVPIASVPLLQKTGHDPVILTAHAGGTKWFPPRDSVRLGFDIPTETLDLTPMVAMKGLGYDHPHTDPAEKPWLSAAFMLAHLGKDDERRPSAFHILAS
jgi:hypothetical protein